MPTPTPVPTTISYFGQKFHDTYLMDNPIKLGGKRFFSKLDHTEMISGNKISKNFTEQTHTVSINIKINVYM